MGLLHVTATLCGGRVMNTSAYTRQLAARGPGENGPRGRLPGDTSDRAVVVVSVDRIWPPQIRLFAAYRPEAYRLNLPASPAVVTYGPPAGALRGLPGFCFGQVCGQPRPLLGMLSYA